MNDPRPCTTCGRDAYAEVKDDDVYAWYGSDHDTSRFIVLATVEQGYVCDKCLADMVAYGQVAHYADMNGLEPPSRLGRAGAVALFTRGARDARRSLQTVWEHEITDGVVIRTGGLVSTDLTTGKVPLPPWMAATGRLWRGLSGCGYGCAPNESDFESLGALYFFVSHAAGRDEGVERAAVQAYERELAVEAQVAKASQRLQSLVVELRDGT